MPEISPFLCDRILTEDLQKLSEISLKMDRGSSSSSKKSESENLQLKLEKIEANNLTLKNDLAEINERIKKRGTIEQRRNVYQILVDAGKKAKNKEAQHTEMRRKFDIKLQEQAEYAAGQLAATKQSLLAERSAYIARREDQIVQYDLKNNVNLNKNCGKIASDYAMAVILIEKLDALLGGGEQGGEQ